jgi:hypothetical protein
MSGNTAQPTTIPLHLHTFVDCFQTRHSHRRADGLAELLVLDPKIQGRSKRDRRLAIPIRDLKEHIGQTSALKHDASDRTSPLSSHLSVLEHVKCQRYTYKDLRHRGLAIVAKDGTPGPRKRKTLWRR